MHITKFIKPYYQQLFFVVLAFVTMIAISFLYVRAIVQEQSEINGNAALDSANATIQSFLTESEISLINIVYSIEEWISAGADQDRVLEHMATLTRWYATKARRSMAFNGVYGYIRGEYLDGAGWVPPQDYEPLSRPWYKGAIRSRGEIFYTDPYVDADTGKIIISASQLIFTRKKQVAGVVALDFDLSIVSEFITGLNTTEGGYGFLLNENLELVGHRDHELHGRNLHDLSPSYAELAQRIRTEGRLSAVEFVDYDGTESVIFISKLFNGWTLGTVIPLTLYYSKVQDMALVLCCIGFTLMGILGFILLRLYHAKDAADAKNQSKSSFLARMSHEIRTPLNAIMGMAELILREGGSLPRHIMDHAGDIKQASLNLLAIINDILDLSKIESGKLELAPAPYMLSSMVNDLVNIVRVRLGEKPIVFLVFIDSKLPNYLIGDEVRIRQIILNMLTNAVKYTKEGFIRLEIRKLSQSDNDITMEIAVADSGQGIKPEDMDKVFGTFERISNKQNKHVEGTGLGMPITRELAQMMGGKIAVESVYGQGSTFRAILPQKIEKPEPIAMVKNVEKKQVLVYGVTPLYMGSLAATLANLKVSYKQAMSPARLRDELTHTPDYVFVEDSISKQGIADIEKLAPSCTIIIFTPKLKGAFTGYRTLITPFHAISVANALNNVPDTTGIQLQEYSGAAFTAPNVKILIVDDIHTNLKVVEGLLAPYEMQMDFSLSGAAAVTMAAKNRYDLILMDHMMPEMDGVVATTKIRQSPGNESVPVIALTANAVHGMKDFFLAEGMDDFIPKPIDPVKLEAMLHKWIPREKRRAVQRQETQEEIYHKVIPEATAEGIDATVVLQRFGGNRDAYFSVIRSFLGHTPGLLDQLAQLRHGNLPDYAITVHGIKGSCASIGAIAAAEQAQILETAAKAGNSAIIESSTDDFLHTIRTLLENLQAMMEREDTNHASAENIKEEKDYPATALLHALLEAVTSYDMETMEKLLTELEQYTYREEQQLVPWLRQQIDNLEYEQLRERLEDRLQEKGEIA